MSFQRHVGVFLHGLEAADVGVPTAVELTTLDVVAQRDDVTHLERILVCSVAKEVKFHLAGIAVESLEHIFLFLPGIACLGSSALQFELLNNLSFNVHFVLVFSF